MPFLRLFGDKAEVKSLPYRVSDRSDVTAAWTTAVKRAEWSFFLVLRQVVKERAVVCVKVGLGDLFFVTDKEEKIAHKNRIDRKHVDFLLCEPATMRPLAGVELDDASNGQKKRQLRDAFVEQAFEAAGFVFQYHRVYRA